VDQLRPENRGVWVIYSSFPLAQYQARKDAINAAIQDVLDRGTYMFGPEMEAFETSFSDHVGCRYGVGVNSGTDAITLSLEALGIGSGDEVITVSHTAVATVAAIARSGATPVLVDIEAGYYTMSPDHFEGAITARTKAVVVVHLYGQAADMDRIIPIARKHNLKIIEDCAQATGARLNGQRLGCLGDVSCFSFYPTKNLGAIGDGGLVATNDVDLASRVRSLRQYGWDDKRNSQVAGYNSRLDELQAAVLNVKLKFLDEDNAARRAHAQKYDQMLSEADLTPPPVRDGAEHSYHLYVIEVDARDLFMKQLAKQDIAAGVHYPLPVHKQVAHQHLLTPGGMAVTEAISGRIVTLPMYPELPENAFAGLAKTLEVWSRG
jgi:dTDP-4-amino-4,6-dideoxygalactose transaminase